MKHKTVRYCETTRTVNCHDIRHIRDGKHYDVDIRLLPILINLHKKGYKTQFSCSGHTDLIPHHLNTFIQFSGIYDFEPPYGFIKTSLNGRTRIEVFTISTALQYVMDKTTARKFIDENIKNLLQWSKNLKKV